jgi:hypothetical protein
LFWHILSRAEYCKSSSRLASVPSTQVCMYAYVWACLSVHLPIRLCVVGLNVVLACSDVLQGCIWSARQTVCLTTCTRSLFVLFIIVLPSK